MADVNGEMFDTLLEELNKVNKLSSTVRSVVSSQKQLSGEVTEVKEFVGFEDEAQTKNVIDKNKLPAKLTTQERVRYENIGKQFTLGAGKEFQKIRDKIRFSEKMSTAKDTFIKGFEKIKSKVKGVKKGGGLWSKIFKIIAILGLVAIIFRDKISKSFPNLTGWFSSMIDKIQSSLGHILGGMYNYLKNCVSGSFKQILTHMSNVTIPNAVGSFFNETLPRVLLQTWLTVMSMFSETAGQRLSEMTGENISFAAQQTANAAEAEAQRQSQEQENVKQEALREMRQIRNLLNSNSKVEENQLQYFIQNSGLLAFDEMSQGFKNSLNQIARAAFGDATIDLQKLIESGQFNITEFARQAQGIMNQGADRETAFVQALNDTLGRTVTREQLGQRAEAVRTMFSNDFIQQMNQFIGSSNRYGTQATEIQERLRAQQQSVQEQFESEARKIPPVQVNFGEALDAAISNQLGVLFESINRFLSGDDSKMISYVRQGVVLLGSFYKSFFERSLGVLFESIRGVGNVYNDPMMNTSPATSTQISGDNNIILNVNLSNSGANGINSGLIVLSGYEQQIISNVTNTNNELKILRDTVKRINNLHSASKEYVDEAVRQVSSGVTAGAISALADRVDSQNRQLSAITDTLFGDRNSAGKCIDSPLTLMALA